MKVLATVLVVAALSAHVNALTIGLKADTGKLLCRVDGDAIEVVGTTCSPLASCLFELEGSGSVVSYKADNGKYLRRGDGNAIIADGTSIDADTKFTLESAGPRGSGKIAVKADNGKYVSRIYYIAGSRNAVEAVKDTKDVYSTFAIFNP